MKIKSVDSARHWASYQQVFVNYTLVPVGAKGSCALLAAGLNRKAATRIAVVDFARNSSIFAAKLADHGMSGLIPRKCILVL